MSVWLGDGVPRWRAGIGKYLSKEGVPRCGTGIGECLSRGGSVMGCWHC